MSHFCLLTLSFVLCSLVSQAASVVYYITSDLQLSCTGQSCLTFTLSQFANNTRGNDLSNTTLLFSSGKHYLRGGYLALSNVSNFEMKSENSIAQIHCTSNFYMFFNQSYNVRITNLEFIGCGGNQVTHVQGFTVYNTKFDGQHFSATALELIETTARIFNTTFVSNSKGTPRRCVQFSIRKDIVL